MTDRPAAHTNPNPKKGYLGIPPFGFPEPLRAHVLKGRTLPNGKACFEGRPGAELPAFAFEDEKQSLLDTHGSHIRDVDVMTYAQYPQVRWCLVGV